MRRVVNRENFTKLLNVISKRSPRRPTRNPESARFHFDLMGSLPAESAGRDDKFILYFRNNLIVSKPNKGFTLVEMLVVIGLISLFISAGFGFFLSTSKAYKSRISTSLSENAGSLTIYQISKDLREARTPEGTSLPAIQAADENSITFYADIETENPAMEERIRYFLEGETLKRGVSSWSSAQGRYLTENEKIKNINQHVVMGGTAIFSYFGANYTGAESPLAFPVNPGGIRVVKIKILTDFDPSRPPGPYEAATTVNLRNLN